MAILWINFHASTVNTVRNEWLTSSDPISFQPSSSTFLNLDEQKKKSHSSVGKWKLLFARRSQANASNESHMVFAMKRDNKTGRNKFSSMWRLWTNSGLGRETNSLRPFLIPAMFSNRLRPLAPTLLQIHRKKTLGATSYVPDTKKTCRTHITDYEKNRYIWCYAGDISTVIVGLTCRASRCLYVISITCKKTAAFTSI
jgi:hypothetical protein